MIAAIKSLRWVEYILQTLTDPRAMGRLVKRNEHASFVLSYLMPVFIAFFDILTIATLSRQTHMFYGKITYGWIALSLFFAFKNTLFAAIMDMSFQLFGYSGSVRELIAVINYSSFPRLFILPLLTIFRIIHFAPPFFYFALIIVSSIFVMLTAVQAVSEIYSVSLGRSFLIYFLPALIVYGSFVLMAAALIMMMAGMF